MKLLIKIFIAVIILLLLLMAISYFWGGSLLEKAGSILLGENIIINRVYFTPHRLSFVMKEISVPGKNIYFSQGVLRLFPLYLECHGLRFGDKVVLSPGEFSFSIRRGGGWRVAAVLDNIALSRLDQKFGPGEVRGDIKGGYDKGQLDLYGVVHLSNLSYMAPRCHFLIFHRKCFRIYSRIPEGNYLLILSIRGRQILWMNYTVIGRGAKHWI